MKTMRLTLLILGAALLASAVVAAPPGDSLKLYLEIGGKAMQNQKYSRAIEAYSRVVELSPGNLEALSNLGAAYAATGNPTKAKSCLEEAIKLDPNSAEVANNLGAVYSEERNGAKAIEYFERAVRLVPKNPSYLTNLGQEYSRAGQISKALPVLRSALELAPKSPIVAFSLGTAFASSATLDSAEYYFEQSLQAGGSSPDLHYFLATVKGRLGKQDVAIKHYKTVLEMQPAHLGALQSLGLIYLDQKRYAEAIEEFGRVTEVDSTYWAGWIGLGAAYSLADMLPQADTVLQRLFAVDSAMGFQMLDIVGKEYSRRKEARESGK